LLKVYELFKFLTAHTAIKVMYKTIFYFHTPVACFILLLCTYSYSSLEETAQDGL